MSVVKLHNDPLSGGFYTVTQAARLLGIESTRRIYGWLQGHPNSGAEAIIRRQYQPLAGAQELGFLDLLEVRFVEHFRKQKISLQSLRRAAKNARDVLKQDHPFATSNVKFLTDRKEVFLQTARETNDRYLLNLMTNQIEIYEALEQVLAKGIAFDQTTGIAERWQPQPHEFPSIVVDPRIAYGKPFVSGGRVPTDALYSLWKAEGGNVHAVADWFEVDRGEVQQAIEFELGMAA